MGSTSEHADRKDFSKTQSIPGILQKLLFSCKFKDEHGKREKVSDIMHRSFFLRICLTRVHFDPYNLKYSAESLQHISF